MKQFRIKLKGFRKDRRGASLVEYSLVLGLVAIASVALISSVGTSVNTIWTKTDTQMKCAADSTTCPD